MIKRWLATACAVSFVALPVGAQELALGKYSGGYQYSPNTAHRVVLDIKSIENGVVTGTGSLYSTARAGGQCGGDYPVEGTLKGNVLRVRSPEKGGKAADCSFSLSATVEGNKLRAKRGSHEFEMSQ